MVPIFPTAISGILESDPRNTFNRFRHISVMAFIKFFAGDNFHVAARTVIRLFRNRVPEFIFCLIRFYNHRIQRIHIQIFIVSSICGNSAKTGRQRQRGGKS